jgi:hypothetical protein
VSTPFPHLLLIDRVTDSVNTATTPISTRTAFSSSGIQPTARGRLPLGSCQGERRMISVFRARDRVARINSVLVLRVLSQTVLWMLWMEAAGLLFKLCVAALVRILYDANFHH